MDILVTYSMQYLSTHINVRDIAVVTFNDGYLQETVHHITSIGSSLPRQNHHHNHENNINTWSTTHVTIDEYLLI